MKTTLDQPNEDDTESALQEDVGAAVQESVPGDAAIRERVARFARFVDPESTPPPLFCSPYPELPHDRPARAVDF